MSNLTTNIKKYLTSKIVDLVEIVLMIFAMFYAIWKTTAINQYLGFVGIIAVLILFWILQKATDKQFDKWKVPDLNIGEKKKLNLVDSAYSIVVAGVIYALVRGVIGNERLLIGLFAGLIIIKEIVKWRKVKKEFSKDINDESKELEDKGKKPWYHIEDNLSDLDKEESQEEDEEESTQEINIENVKGDVSAENTIVKKENVPGDVEDDDEAVDRIYTEATEKKGE